MATRKYTSLPYTEYTVATGHYDTTRVWPINKIVLHSSASNRQGLIDTFGGGTRMVSAHYGIDNDGSILAFLEEYNTAYHAGNYDVNQCSIGIEHIDNGATVKLHTDAQYATSIKLVADICKFYSIPADSTHIVPHSSIVATACPNGLDVNRIISGAYALLNTSNPAPVVITDQTKLPILDENGNQMEVGAVRSRLADQKQQIDNQANEISALQSSVTALNAKIADLEAKLASIPPSDSQASILLQKIHDVLYGSGFWWTKLSKIKTLLPK